MLAVSEQSLYNIKAFSTTHSASPKQTGWESTKSWERMADQSWSKEYSMPYNVLSNISWNQMEEEGGIFLSASWWEVVNKLFILLSCPHSFSSLIRLFLSQLTSFLTFSPLTLFPIPPAVGRDQLTRGALSRVRVKEKKVHAHLSVYFHEARLDVTLIAMV